ncbi:MAG TPA: lanthionine synthetase LanC family protein [Puia sp.]|nr:lanthionine synthetase LanC family protein [Puia sp.]
MELNQRIGHTISRVHSMIAGRRAPEDGLLTGNLGLAIYHSCIARYTRAPIQDTALLMEDILERVESMQSTLQTCLYSNGLSGLGAVIQFLIEKDEIDFDLEENFAVIDEFIFEKSLAAIGDGYVEYLHGGGGVLYYFHSRRPESRIVRYQEQLVASILQQVGKDPLGVRIPRGKFHWNKNDDYDLSLAHGLCGVLLVLLAVLEAGNVHNGDQIRAYLEKAAAFVFDLKKPVDRNNGVYAAFPIYLGKENGPGEIARTKSWGPSRLAWCYGDLGWVLFFYRYGRYTRDIRFLELADEIGNYVIPRTTMGETSSSTAHFCHGHAGLAYMYKTLYRVSGKMAYRQAGEFWLKETLETLDLEMEQSFYKEKALETNFLEGLAGINLALASFLEEEDPGWGKFLLL